MNERNDAGWIGDSEVARHARAQERRGMNIYSVIAAVALAVLVFMWWWGH